MFCLILYLSVLKTVVLRYVLSYRFCCPKGTQRGMVMFCPVVIFVLTGHDRVTLCRQFCPNGTQQDENVYPNGTQKSNVMFCLVFCFVLSGHNKVTLCFFPLFFISLMGQSSVTLCFVFEFRRILLFPVPRQQINTLTSFLDGSAVYGNTQEILDTLKGANGQWSLISA